MKWKEDGSQPMNSMTRRPPAHDNITKPDEPVRNRTIRSGPFGGAGYRLVENHLA